MRKKRYFTGRDLLKMTGTDFGAVLLVMDANNSSAQAAAAAGDKILPMGTNEAVLAAAAPDAWNIRIEWIKLRRSPQHRL